MLAKNVKKVEMGIDKAGKGWYNLNNNFEEVVMDNRIVFGIMCIIFNAYGVPCFMQGKIKTGIWRIVLMYATLGVVGIINMVKGIILGIEVLKMSDEEYAEKKYTLDSGIPAAK